MEAPTDDTRAPLDALSVADCWAHLRSGVVGRVAVVHDGRPDIFPVNFVVDHGSVVFRTGSGSLFRSADRQPVEAMALPLLPWHSGPKPRIVRIHPDAVSGRRFAVAGGFGAPDTRADEAVQGPSA